MASIFSPSYATIATLAAPPASTFLPVYARRPSSAFTGYPRVRTIGDHSSVTSRDSYLYGRETLDFDLSDSEDLVRSVVECGQSQSEPAQAGMSAFRRSNTIPTIEVKPGQTLAEALLASALPSCQSGEKYVIFVNSEKDRAALEEASGGEAGISILLEDNMTMPAAEYGPTGTGDYPAERPSGNFQFTPVTIVLMVAGVFVVAFVGKWAVLLTAGCIVEPRAQSSAVPDIEAGSNPDGADVNHSLPPSVADSSRPGSVRLSKTSTGVSEEIELRNLGIDNSDIAPPSPVHLWSPLERAD